jgi:acyl phosphate:glycerol-3-phosphate acyltransferase
MFGLIFLFIFIAAGYFTGSVCSAVIVCNFCKLPDPRSEGSKNPGATNVLRLSGKKYAAIVLLVDILKGFLPVLIAKIFGYENAALGVIGLAAVIGHMYPYFFDFKGGKGVATSLGVLFGINLTLGLIACAIWVLVALISRMSSLASIITLLLAPLLSLTYSLSFSSFVPLMVMSACVLYKHQENFERIKEGKESKIEL